MTRTPTLIAALAVLLVGCSGERSGTDFQSSWTNSPDRRWAGPEYWANRIQDWQVRDGRLECTAERPVRTVHLLTRRLSGGLGRFDMSVRLGPIGSAAADSAGGGAGFLIGAGADLDYRAAALIHNSYGEGAGIYAGINSDGVLFIRDFEIEDGWIAVSEDGLLATDTVILSLHAEPEGDSYALELTATPAAETGEPVTLRLGLANASRLAGNIALVCDARRSATRRFWFDTWRMSGEVLEAHESRRFGPLIGSQHTLSRGTLKLTAQLMPVGDADAKSVELQVSDGSAWTTIASAPVVTPGYTATFTLERWDDSRDVPYRLAYELGSTDGMARPYYTGGMIRRDPVDDQEIVVAAFTGNHNTAHPGVDRGYFPWSYGIWFPHADIIAHVSAHEPHFLFFSGDQVYEGASPTAADFSNPYEDYLYKWYLWYWAFGELTANIPSVSIPDDHDVYHGNVWGAGGVATPPGTSGAAAQDAGGYKLPAEFVNMVQRTQASHLPDPYDPTPVGQGIEVYYTDIVYGGVSFAVIEDRKFKSAPAPLLPAGEIWNGWPQNPEFDARTDADAPGAVLLGDRQLAFLEDWAADWSDGAWMKVVLSQTIFANVATLPDSATSGSVIPSLQILGPADYAENEKLVSDMDSNGWPQTGRNNALRTMRKGFAVHLAGDQHLGSTIQYGVDDWGDAGFALCVPSIANFWPRRWYPPLSGGHRFAGAPRYAGEYEDGFGNKMTVFAVSNPVRSGAEPGMLHDRAPGYGIARFDRQQRTISLAAWPRWADPLASDGPYPGWPVTFAQTDNYGRDAVAYLPRLEVSGLSDPVVQVVSEATGEVVYTLRVSGASFTPTVFAGGSYTIRVGEPDSDDMRTFTGIRGTSTPQETLAIDFGGN